MGIGCLRLGKVTTGKGIEKFALAAESLRYGRLRHFKGYFFYQRVFSSDVSSYTTNSLVPYFSYQSPPKRLLPTMKKTTRPILPGPTTALFTSRLLLRPMQTSDLENFHLLRTQIEVMRWTSTGNVDTDKEATRIWINRSLPPNDATTFNFAIEELSAPGVAIGSVGLHLFDPPECGYMLRSQYWRRGYATEAFRRWLQAWWELPRREIVIEDPNLESESDAEAVVVPEVLTAVIAAENAASARILEATGFRHVSDQVVEENGASVKLITLELERPK